MKNVSVKDCLWLTHRQGDSCSEPGAVGAPRQGLEPGDGGGRQRHGQCMGDTAHGRDGHLNPTPSTGWKLLSATGCSPQSTAGRLHPAQHPTCGLLPCGMRWWSHCHAMHVPHCAPHGLMPAARCLRVPHPSPRCQEKVLSIAALPTADTSTALSRVYPAVPQGPVSAVCRADAARSWSRFPSAKVTPCLSRQQRSSSSHRH